MFLFLIDPELLIHNEKSSDHNLNPPQCLAWLCQSELQAKKPHLLLFRPTHTMHFQAIFFSLPSASWTRLIYLQPLSLSTGRYQAWPWNQYEPVRRDISSLSCSSKWGKLPVVLREELAAHRPFLSPYMANTEIIFCQENGPRLNSKLYLYDEASLKSPSRPRSYYRICSGKGREGEVGD